MRPKILVLYHLLRTPKSILSLNNRYYRSFFYPIFGVCPCSDWFSPGDKLTSAVFFAKVDLIMVQTG